MQAELTLAERASSDAYANELQRKEKISAAVRYGVLLVMGLVMLYPMIWLVGASFKTNAEVFTEIGFWPSRFDFSAYAKGWKTSTEYTFATYFLNSFLIIIPKVIVTVISCVLVAYAFARFEFWGKKTLFGIMVGTMMLPLIILRLPQYLMFKEFGWLDSYLPLIVPSAFATDTFFVFMLVQFLRGIPRDMEEAAQIDGCTRWQAFWTIEFPLARSGLASAGIFAFLTSWNEYALASQLTRTTASKTMPVGLMDFTAQFTVDWTGMSAMAVLIIVPALVLTFIVQKHLIAGLTFGGVKG